MTRYSKLQAVIACSVSLALSAVAQINPNGNPGDWTSDTGGPQSLTTSPTGGPSGHGYTAIQDNPGAYGYGYGTGGYSFFGAPSGSYPVSAPFTQSIAIYINTGWASGPIPSQDGFWIDMSPNGSDPAGQGEHNFRVTSTGTGTVNVTTDGNGILGSITQSGWYDFLMTYTPGSTPTSQVNTTMTIYDDATSSTLASTTLGDDTVSSGLETQYLDGSGYVWLPVWAPGFAGGTLDVADVDVTSAPAPDTASTLALLGAASTLVIGLRRRFSRA